MGRGSRRRCDDPPEDGHVGAQEVREVSMYLLASGLGPRPRFRRRQSTRIRVSPRVTESGSLHLVTDMHAGFRLFTKGRGYTSSARCRCRCTVYIYKLGSFLYTNLALFISQ